MQDGPKDPSKPEGLTGFSRWILGRYPRRTLVRAAILGLVCFLVFQFLYKPVRVVGISMEPTYRDGTVNVLDLRAYARRGPVRGEVVGIAFTGGSVLLLKRIIALPGETVEIRDGTVWVNGAPLEEPYLQNQEPWKLEPRLLGPEEYYVIGDNRTMSMDEHTFGRVERHRILGRVLW